MSSLHEQLYEEMRAPKPAATGAIRQPQQLVARIKRSSKYFGQTEPGEWFDVRGVGDRSYPWRGNHNNYRSSDLAFGLRLDDGSVIELRSA